MKNIVLFLTMLTASALLIALPAFSSSGPYGTSGPLDYTVYEQGVKSDHTATVSSSGPYGASVVFGVVRGEVSKRAATPGGSGPFGAIASNGMIPDSEAVTDERCILVAANCASDR
jgi:hypothetical protein